MRIQDCSVMKDSQRQTMNLIQNYPWISWQYMPCSILDTSYSNGSFSIHPQANSSAQSSWVSCSKKYVIMCTSCGGFGVLLGALYIALYFILRSHTSSLHYFETVPTYIAALVFIITGILMICFGWRKNRFGFLVKLCGGCCILCAALCIVITVATIVVHMSRLQSLHECVYQAQRHSCTCTVRLPTVLQTSLNSNQLTLQSKNIDLGYEEGGTKYTFADTMDCDVVHGALYSCLRALFALSVIGILVALATGMLVYQLLGHERKKKYWEQLEMRSRSLYPRHPPGPCCGCCAQNRTPTFQWPSWLSYEDSRYWASGNFYSPGPERCGNRPCQGHPTTGEEVTPRRGGTWNWLPWRPSNSSSANTSDSQESSGRAQNSPGSTAAGPDAHYGFPLSINTRSPIAVRNSQSFSQVPFRRLPTSSSTASTPPVPWGPPPPYSRGGSVNSGGSSTLSPNGSPSHFSNPDPYKSAHQSRCDWKDGEISPGSLSTLYGQSGNNSDAGLHHQEETQRRIKRALLFGAASASSPHLKPINEFGVSLCASALCSNSNNSCCQERQRNIPQSPVQRASEESSPSGSKYQNKIEPESEIYFADVSSCTHSVRNNGDESSTYEEINRYEMSPHERYTQNSPKRPSSLGQQIAVPQTQVQRAGSLNTILEKRQVHRLDKYEPGDNIFNALQPPIDPRNAPFRKENQDTRRQPIFGHDDSRLLGHPCDFIQQESPMDKHIKSSFVPYKREKNESNNIVHSPFMQRHEIQSKKEEMLKNQFSGRTQRHEQFPKRNFSQMEPFKEEENLEEQWKKDKGLSPDEEVAALTSNFVETDDQVDSESCTHSVAV
ncbi:uncharacterized protein LOC136030079 isoform X1 [Artemia franciscana]